MKQDKLIFEVWHSYLFKKQWSLLCA